MKSFQLNGLAAVCAGEEQLLRFMGRNEYFLFDIPTNRRQTSQAEDE